MASICETFTAPDRVVTLISTQVLTIPVTISGAPITSTTSVLASATACSTPSPINGTAVDPVCTVTSLFIPAETILPGVIQVTQSLSSTILQSLSTSQGDVSSTCRAAPTTASVSSSTSTTTTPGTTSTTTTPSAETSVAASTTPGQVLPETTSVPIVDPASLVPVSGDSSSSPGRSTITSFRTVVITMTDANGRETVMTSASATLNTVSGPGSASNHTGAIAGGIAGGIAAIILAVVAFLLLRRRGYFRREDEHFNDDIWMPPNHSADDNFDDGTGGGGGGGSSLEEKEAGQPEMAQRSPSRASWLSGERAPSMYLDSYGSQYGMSNIAAQQNAEMAPAPDGSQAGHAQATSMSLGYAASRRLSHRSMHSGSSHSVSHEGHLSRQPTLPRLPPPNHRFTHDFYQQMPPPQHLQNRHSFPQHQPMPPHVQREIDGCDPTISDHSDSNRTAATQGSRDEPSSHASHHYRSTSSGAASIASRRMSHHTRPRPSLAVLTALDSKQPTSGSGYSSAANDSTCSQVPALSATSFGSGSSARSSALPTPHAVPTQVEQGILNKVQGVSEGLYLKPIPRPGGMERTYSSDSCMAPSQFLGARIVNTDERERDDAVSLSAGPDTQEVIA